MKNEEESLAERENALNFIYITLRQLLGMEGSEQKAGKVNLFLRVPSQESWTSRLARRTSGSTASMCQCLEGWERTSLWTTSTSVSVWIMMITLFSSQPP